jgi:hypothetical protein
MHSGIGPLDRGKEKQGSGTKNRDEREFIAKLSGECQSSSSRSQEDLTALVATDSQSMPKGWPPSGKKDFFAIAPNDPTAFAGRRPRAGPPTTVYGAADRLLSHYIVQRYDENRQAKNL